MSDSLFHSFFDDAAIFPPGLAPLEKAVRDHIRRSENDVTDPFIGPLILPLKEVERAAGVAGDKNIDISVIADASELEELSTLMDSLSSRGDRISIVALEAKVRENVAEEIRQVTRFAERHPTLQSFVELPYSQVTIENLGVLAESGLGLKFRTGGVKQDLFPSSEEVIDVIAKALRFGLPFKLTAGLHRALRYEDPVTGFQHFGFLNIAAATAALREGADVEAALQLLNSDDANAVAAKAAENREWRNWFKSFGTCSVTEPAGTLAELGLLNNSLAVQFE